MAIKRLVLTLNNLHAKCGNLCLDATGGEKGAVLPNQADVSPKHAAVILSQLGLLVHRKQMEVKQSKSWMDAATIPLG